MSTKAVVRNFYTQALANLLAVENKLLVGVGNQIAWPIEGSPPDVDPTTTTQAGLIAFREPTQKRGVKLVLSNYSGPLTTVVLAGKRWAYTGDTYALLAQNEATHLLVQASIVHSELVAGGYRSFGIHERCVYTGTGTIQTANVSQNRLVYLEYFQEVDIQTGITEAVNLIVRVRS